MIENPSTFERKELFHPESLKVFRFRHGSTEYTELRADVPTDEFDLTEEGKKEVEKGVHAIIQSLDKDKCVVVLASSPRVRSVASMQLARDIFKENGFTVWESRDDSRLIRKNIRSGDTLNDDEKPIEKGEEGFAEARRKVLEELSQFSDSSTDASTVWANNPEQIAHLEKFDEVGERAKKDLVLLFKIAHQMQSKTDKQIVVASFEHAETLDELTSLFSEGEISQKKGRPIGKGEPLEMDISTKDYSAALSLPLRPDVQKIAINFDKQTKKFLSNESQ